MYLRCCARCVQSFAAVCLFKNLKKKKNFSFFNKKKKKKKIVSQSSFRVYFQARKRFVESVKFRRGVKANRLGRVIYRFELRFSQIFTESKDIRNPVAAGICDRLLNFGR